MKGREETIMNGSHVHTNAHHLNTATLTDSTIVFE